MQKTAFYWFLAVATLLAACGASGPSDEEIATTAQAIGGASAAGTIPTGLPARVQVGLFNDTGDTWMKTSGVKWDTRYRYFTKGWANNWGYGAYDGSWGLSYMNECSSQGFIPAIQYYQMNGEPGGSESAFLAKAQNATTMRSYFGDFKLLMQRAKDFGKPVLVLLEADGYAFLEQQTAGNPNAPAAVASTGLPELAGLPNTVAGWGLAFLQLKKSVGAQNAVLGIHISAWASGQDIATYSVTTDLNPAVDTVYSFLSPLGLGTNVTGQTYDVLVGDPSDRDADFYRLVQGDGGAHWWDTSDTASINSRSMNRFAEWLRLWNQKAQKRWVLWQIPIGNSNHRNVYNDGSSGAGYKDFRAEYFFANGTAHITKFADAGAIALLFGAGAGGQSSYANDTYTDGQLFMKSRAGAILNAGGVALSSGGTAPPPPPPPPPTCTLTNGTGTGLLGEYYATMALPVTGTAPTKSRTDPTVNFNWGSASPDPAIPADGFSVRWRGKVEPRVTDTHTFYTTSDDGVRLWVNGQKLIDNWTNHAPTENSGTIALSAGTQYDIVMEFYENGGGATATLSWSSANGCEAKKIVPQTQLRPATTTTAPSDPAQYGFEGSVQAWQATGAPLAGISSSGARAFAGVSSLAVAINGTGGGRTFIANPNIPAGKMVTFQVWIPAGAQLSSVQPYVLQGAAGGWAWTGSWRAVSTLTAGAWNAITVAVPANAAALAELGVELVTSSGANVSATVYVDSIRW